MAHPDLFTRTLPLGEVLAWGVAELAGAGLPTAKLDAELLLGAVLSLARAQVLARAHTTVRRPERGHFAALIQRRRRGEPVAYILGRAEFYGRDFLVDRRVLIPRPETEELVDRCLDTLAPLPALGGVGGGLAPRPALGGVGGGRVADIGTGSGAIAVTLAAERADLALVATDNSEGALAVAQENARRHGVEGRIEFRRGSLLEPLAGLPPFDLLVANLPYVGTDEQELLAPDVRDFEPHEALFAGPEGLDLFAPFFEQLQTLAVLRPGGTVLLEIGYAQGPALLRLARSRFPDARRVALHKDLARHDRFVELVP